MLGRNSLIVFVDQTKAAIFSDFKTTRTLPAYLPANVNVMSIVHEKWNLYSLDPHTFRALKTGMD